MTYVNPHLYDAQGDLPDTVTDAQIVAGSPGWTGKFLTTGSSWTYVKNSPWWPAGVRARQHKFHDLGTTERERCAASHNELNVGMDNGSDTKAGVTMWIYEEFVLPAAFFPARFAGGSWNFFSINWHHSSGPNGSTGQVPFHIGATDARGKGFYELFCQVRGGKQISAAPPGTQPSSTWPTEPNNEDFILDSPIKLDHVYRVMVRMTLAPNGTPPQRNRFLSTNQPGAYIVPLSTGDSHGIIEVWVDGDLKVSKRRPTSYYDLSMYLRSDIGRNPSETGDIEYWATKMTLARTRDELFSLIQPVTADTFEPGGDSGGGTPEPTHRFRVSAHNVKGYGPWSQEVAA